MSSFDDLGVVTNPFRQKNSRYKSGYHTGTDIVLKNSSVHSFTGGTVVKTGTTGAYGNHIQVKDDNGKYVLYAHLKSPTPFKVGDKVTKGSWLGLQGSTGNSTGNHLHVEVFELVNGKKSLLNPQLYLTGGNNSLVGDIMTSTGKGAIAAGVAARQDLTLFSRVNAWLTGGGWQPLLVRIVLVIFGLLLLYAAAKSFLNRR